MLKVTELAKSYTQGKRKIEILKGLNLSVEKGESIAILGQSGSGKSTFLSVMAGIDSIDSGEILFDDVTMTNLSEDEMTSFRGQQMGIVFQQFHLLPHLSALENVSLPLEIFGVSAKEASDKAKDLLEKVGLEHRYDHFPSQLSGGEKQRVAIARSLIADPKLLLADEPSGSLDEETGVQIMELIFDLVEKLETTLILVTHNQELAKRCEKIYQLEHGKLHLMNLVEA